MAKSVVTVQGGLGCLGAKIVIEKFTASSPLNHEEDARALHELLFREVPYLTLRALGELIRKHDPC